MFGGRGRRSSRGIHHQNTVLGGCIQIDIVHTDPRAADDPQFFRLLDQLAIHRRAAANNDAVRISDDAQQFVSRYFVVNNGLDRIRPLDELNPRGIDAVEKQDFIARHLTYLPRSLRFVPEQIRYWTMNWQKKSEGNPRHTYRRKFPVEPRHPLR